jgi:hypothetical protein
MYNAVLKGTPDLAHSVFVQLNYIGKYCSYALCITDY